MRSADSQQANQSHLRPLTFRPFPLRQSGQSSRSNVLKTNPIWAHCGGVGVGVGAGVNVGYSACLREALLRILLRRSVGCHLAKLLSAPNHHSMSLRCARAEAEQTDRVCLSVWLGSTGTIGWLAAVSCTSDAAGRIAQVLPLAHNVHHSHNT